MIKSFADKETEKVFNREFSKKLPSDIQHSARRKLEILNAAESLQDLRIPPSNRLEKLVGDRKGSVFASTSNGGFVLSGKPPKLTKFKSLIITEQRKVEI